MPPKKKAAPKRTLVVELPEELLMKVVKAANNDGKSTHDWVNPRLEKMLTEALK